MVGVWTKYGFGFGADEVAAIQDAMAKFPSHAENGSVEEEQAALAVAGIQSLEIAQH